MKHRLIIGMVLLTVAAAVFAQQNRGNVNSRAQNPSYEGDIAAVLAELEPGALDQAEIDGMLLMREEEKLARDVYRTLADQWDIRSFENIARSEQTHMDAMELLLDRYDLDDPVKSNEVGAFTSPLMKELYDDLTAMGATSYTDAIKVGAKIEELDIADLVELIEASDNEDIRVVYQNLLKGSRNHLRSFDMQIRRNGERYTPAHLTVAEYERIASSPRETGMIIGDSDYVF